jgi:hypothetical protein
VHGAVLTIDGHQLGTGGGAQRLHDWRASNQAFFVGECQPTTELQSTHRDGQARETDNAVHNNVGGFDNVGEVVDDMRKRKRCRHLCASRRVGDGNDLRPKLERLPYERIGGAANTERDHLIAVALGAHDIEGLFSD